MQAEEQLKPNRWLHVRLPRQFSDQEFEAFCAHAEVWCAMVQQTLARWQTLGYEFPAPRYRFFPPVLSEDRRTATLPLGGEQTLGTRSLFENSMSTFLWMHFPFAFQLEAEEGITETIVVPHPSTSWRPCLERLAPGESHSSRPSLPRAAREDRSSPTEQVKWWLYSGLPKW